MSRRDTIIIAILVNAGLLMILFATAMKSEPKKNVKKQAVELAQVEKKIDATSLDPLNESINDVSTRLALGEPEEIIFAEPLSDEELVFSSAFENSKVEILKEERKSPEIKTHSLVVKKGDVLEKIAKDYGTSVTILMEINHLASSQLKIGQILKIPENEKSPLPSTTKIYEDAESYYIVKEGDNPWMIASKNKVKWEDILRLNNLDEQKARRLRPGDKLRLR